MRKISYLFCAALLILSLIITGCGAGNTASTQEATTVAAATAAATQGATEAATTEAAKGDSVPDGATKLEDGTVINPPGVFPIAVADEPYNMTCFMPVQPHISIKDNMLLEYMEKRTNIHVDFMEVTNLESDQQLNLLLASGESLPDMFAVNMGAQRLQAYGSTGTFIEVTDLINKWTVNVGLVWEETAPYGEMACRTLDGKLYGLPNFNGCFHCNYQHRGWINVEWLDRLGLDMPETTDDYYNALKAFKEQDANGNGDTDDEIPLIGMKNGWNSTVEKFLMNAFVINNGNDRVNVVNGELQAAYITPEWREGLIFYRQLYNEGLLDAECFIMDDTEAKMLAANPNGNQIGSFFSGVPTQVGSAEGIPQQYERILPLKGPNGFQGVAYFPDYPTVNLVVTSYCKNPELAVRWGDAWLDGTMEHFVMARAGVAGYEYAHELDGTEGLVGLDGKPAVVYTSSEALGEENNIYWLYGAPLEYMPNWIRTGNAYSLEQSDEYNQEAIIFMAALDYEKFKPADIVPPLKFTDDEQMKLSEIKTMLKTYVEENFASFVTGKKSIESDWDAYVDEIKAMGVDDMLKMMDDAWQMWK